MRRKTITRIIRIIISRKSLHRQHRGLGVAGKNERKIEREREKEGRRKREKGRESKRD